MVCRCGKNQKWNETCYFKKSADWDKCTKNEAIVKFRIYRTNYNCTLKNKEKIDIVKNDQSNYEDDFYIMPLKYAEAMFKIINKQKKFKNCKTLEEKQKYIFKNCCLCVDFENAEQKYVIKKI